MNSGQYTFRQNYQKNIYIAWHDFLPGGGGGGGTSQCTQKAKYPPILKVPEPAQLSFSYSDTKYNSLLQNCHLCAAPAIRVLTKALKSIALFINCFR